MLRLCQRIIWFKRSTEHHPLSQMFAAVLSNSHNFPNPSWNLGIKTHPIIVEASDSETRSRKENSPLMLRDINCINGLCCLFSADLNEVYAALRRGRSGQGSLPCPKPRQSRPGTSPASPHMHTLPPKPAVGSSNRRLDRRGCRSI